MKLQTAHFTLTLLLSASAAMSADVTVYSSDVPAGSGSWTTADNKVTLTDSSGNFTAGGSGAGSYGGSGSNAAFDNSDGASLTLTFAADAGLRRIGAIWTRSSAVISGFLADPGLAVSGGGATATYDAGTGSVTISQPWNGGTVILYEFANPGASAGRTLTFSFAEDTGGAAGYQFALNRIVYQDSAQAPSIAAGLPAVTTVAQGTATTLSVTLDPGTLPLPAYLWERDALPIDGVYVTVGTGSTFSVNNAAASDGGRYRVTVTNTAGSDVSTGDLVVDLDADNDGLPNTFETNTDVYVSPTDTGTDPNDSDSDDDGLLDGDEVATHLTNPNVADSDSDGLSDGAEVNDHTTNPLVADSDSDGLNDGAEVITHLTDPKTVDSDGDGFSDGWEVNELASNPKLASSPDLSSGRNAIGIKFSSGFGDRPNHLLEPGMFAGAPTYVQRNWNRSDPTVGSGTQADIAAPTAGVLVDGSGTPTSATLSFSANNLWSANNESQTTYGRLFSGYLDSNAANPSITVTVDSIPYARYDVVVYMGSAFNSANIGRVGLNGVDYQYSFSTVVANGEAPAYVRSTDSSTYFGSSRFNPSANVVVFRGITGPSASIIHTRINSNAGIFAIQIVEDPDGDNDGMGDFYETANSLNKLVNDAGISADADGFTNLEEHDLGTDPNLADSDGDGLSDSAEFNDILSNPFMADTDRDDLSDGAEVNTHGSSPVNTDSDDDGYNDGHEVNAISSNPADAESPGGPNPPAVGIAFASQFGEQINRAFSVDTYAGVAAVRQKNWNRSFPLPTGVLTASNIDIEKPTAGELTDSAGVSTAMTLSLAAAGVWSDFNEQMTPYGRLYNSFAYNDAATPNISVTLGAIPYPTYDVYVYVGADFNGRTGLVTSGSTSYSFTTGSNSTGGLSDYVETTDATGYPVANYCVFRNQSGASFSFDVVRGNNNVGLFGIQVVGASAAPIYAAWAAINAGGQGAALDFDGDGVSNGVEYFMGESGSGFTANPKPVNNVVTWPKNPAAVATYVIQTSTNLADEGSPGGWINAVTGVVDNGNSVAFTLPAGGPRAFARLKVLIP
jgi:hypothetical protein